MGEIKGLGEHSLNVSDSEAVAVTVSDKEQHPKLKRVASLDIFRGLTVAVLLSFSPSLISVQLNLGTVSKPG